HAKKSRKSFESNTSASAHAIATVEIIKNTPNNIGTRIPINIGINTSDEEDDTVEE
ncbi:10616_t:CDS:2, partial [Scutellospora calospora]